MDTECVATLKHNTCSILISLASRDCVLAKFLLLMHFIATCQSRFCNKNAYMTVHTNEARTAGHCPRRSYDLPLYVCLWTQLRRRRDQSDPSCWTQTSRQTPWSTQENKHCSFKETRLEIKQACPTVFPRMHEIPFHMKMMLKRSFDKENINDEVAKKDYCT